MEHSRYPSLEPSHRPMSLRAPWNPDQPCADRMPPSYRRWITLGGLSPPPNPARQAWRIPSPPTPNHTQPTARLTCATPWRPCREDNSSRPISRSMAVDSHATDVAPEHDDHTAPCPPLEVVACTPATLYTLCHRSAATSRDHEDASSEPPSAHPFRCLNHPSICSCCVLIPNVTVAVASSFQNQGTRTPWIRSLHHPSSPPTPSPQRLPALPTAPHPHTDIHHRQVTSQA